MAPPWPCCSAETPGIGARRVDEREQREAVPVRELHHPHRLPVALRIGHAEVPLRALLEVAALLVADEGDRAAAEAADAGYERLVVRPPAVAVQLDEVVQQPLDVVERVRPVGMARELDGAPDLLVGDLGLHALELLLEPLEVAGYAGAAEQAQPSELGKPLAKAKLLVSCHSTRSRTAAAGAPGTAAARDAAGSRPRARSGSSTRRGRSRRGASPASSAARREGR